MTQTALGGHVERQCPSWRSGDEDDEVNTATSRPWNLLKIYSVAEELSGMALADQKPVIKDVLIIGGSLTSLMHGIMLKDLGYNVRILEKDIGSPESHMAGICAAADVLEFLNKHDRLQQPFGIPSEYFQSIDNQCRTRVFLKAPRLMTSWDALYYRLRANFDGLKSDYYPNPIVPEASSPTILYDSGKRVQDIVVDAGMVLVKFEDRATGEYKEAKADLLLGADGPNSIVRKLFMPTPTTRQPFLGIIAWRGVVPELEVSEKTRKLFEKEISYYIMHENHVIVYNIPGDKGSLEAGKRLLNFCWYTNEDTGSFADIMTDVSGHRHHATVPVGKVREGVWRRRREIGNEVLSEPFKEVMNKIARPFVQVVTDYYTPKAVFGDGRVLLVGDAKTLFRPHIAFSTNQAAFDCLLVEKYVKGEIDIAEWESRVLQFGYLHWLRSIYYSVYFQRHPIFWVVPALQYWITSATCMIRNYWKGQLLRSQL